MSECGEIRIRTEGSFIWHIPDFSYFRHEYNSSLISPDFKFNRHTWYVATDANRKEPGKLALLVRRRRIGPSYPWIFAYRMRVKYINSDGQNRWYSPVLIKEFSPPTPLQDSTRFAVCFEFALPESASLLTLGDVLSLHLTFDLGIRTSPTPTLVVDSADGERCSSSSSTSDVGTQTCTSNLSNQDCSSNTCGIDKLLLNFKDLLLNEVDCDVSLNVKGRQFRAHKLILKARSPVFAATFRQGTPEGESEVVDIDDCDPDAFDDFLLYLYTGRLDKLDGNSVVHLHQIGQKYDVKELAAVCAKFMAENLTADNFCGFIAAALKHRELDLVESANKFFATNLKEIVASETWRSFFMEHSTQAHDLLNKALARNKLLSISEQ